LVPDADTEIDAVPPVARTSELGETAVVGAEGAVSPRTVIARRTNSGHFPSVKEGKSISILC
jgi:hypothetical protein